MTIRVRERKNEREREGGYYFAVSYKYSFPLADESRLALQAVSCVKSANERPLQARGEGEFLALFSPHGPLQREEEATREQEERKEKER